MIFMVVKNSDVEQEGGLLRGRVGYTLISGRRMELDVSQRDSGMT